MTMDVALGREALEYMCERLASGHTLANSLAQFCDRIRRVYTLLPAGASHENLADFDQGGKLQSGSLPASSTSPIVPVPNTDAALSRRLTEWMSGGDSRI